MINPVQLLTSVAECIENRTPLDCKSWIICWHEKKLKCLPARCRGQIEIIFLQVSEYDCSHGLALEQWSEIKRTMANFFENVPTQIVTQKTIPATIGKPLSEGVTNHL